MGWRPCSSRIVEHEARRANLETLDLTEPFLEAGMLELRNSARDLVHPNAKGHEIIAEALFRWMKERLPEGLHSSS